MNRRQQHLIDRALGNELSESERQEVEAAIAGNPETREEFERMQRVTSLARGAARRSFAPGFADRVMERPFTRAARETSSIADLLLPLFARVAPVAVAAAIGFALYNFSISRDSDQSVFEAAFGLPPVSTEAAYDIALGSVGVDGIVEEGIEQ